MTFRLAVDCDLCEGHVKVDWYCLTCPANLCEKCHVLHTSRKTFKKHKVITRDKYRQAKRDGPTPRHTKCATHAKNDVTLKCITCQELVCVECVPNAHNGHKFESLDAAISRSRKNLADFIVQLEERQKSITAMLEGNSKALDDSQSKSNQTKQQISEMRNYVSAVMYKEMQKLFEGVDKNAETMEKELSISNGDLEGKHDHVARLLATARSMLDHENSDNIDKFVNHNSSLVSYDIAKTATFSFPSFNAISPSVSPLLGTLTFQTLNVSNVSGTRLPVVSDVEVIRTLKSGFPLSEIRSSEALHAWCCHYDKTSLVLLDNKGKRMKSLNLGFDIQGFAITKTGEFIVCDPCNECIKKVTPAGRVSVLCSTSPLWPRGLCLNDQQQPVVCLGKSLVVYSPDCQTKLYDFTYDQQGQPLFKGSYRVNTNGECCCVVDDMANQVVTIDKKGMLRWTYRGRPGSDENFDPCNICCDSYQNVIVADRDNKKVHLLDKDGQFVLYITEKVNMNYPFGLCVIDNGELWVGEYIDKGKIHVIKYIKQ